MKFTGAICIAFVIILLSSLALTNAVVEDEKLVVCNPKELEPCSPAVKTRSKPSTQCCAMLKKEEPCLCGYINEPVYGQYIKSNNAHKAFSACGIPPLHC
ncbi:unnamed protein product [Eruca vesicaria subsp. sativa]|uniref:Bifunctional inhibitor/plant lipid transfer protein/seed storage helical domain-containing protein n=1 Tax=Eruca vesicaria subsp. sativa TaxID=29727 RepID=A0ABC8LN32_ERUVS|nr:unnamed protein product [Eruca vesicaria subsp. sativa]